jgi:hypothetical protein
VRYALPTELATVKTSVMSLNPFGTGASRLGTALAEQVKLAAAKSGAAARNASGNQLQAADIRNLLQRVDLEVRPMKFGWFGRARLGNAFKWKLQEEGFTPAAADELTQAVLLHLLRPAPAAPSAPIKPNRAMRRREAAAAKRR